MHSSQGTPVKALQPRYSSRCTPNWLIHSQSMHFKSKLIHSQLMHFSQGTLLNALQSLPYSPYRPIGTPVNAAQLMQSSQCQLINAINAKTPHKDITPGYRRMTTHKGTAQGHRTRVLHIEIAHGHPTRIWHRTQEKTI